MAFTLRVGSDKGSVIILLRPLCTIVKHWSELLMLQEQSSDIEKSHECKNVFSTMHEIQLVIDHVTQLQDSKACPP